jgi:hypothetical protein
MPKGPSRSNLPLDPRGPKIYMPNDLGRLLTATGGLWFSDNRLLKYQVQLLECPDMSLYVCPKSTIIPPH